MESVGHAKSYSLLPIIQHPIIWQFVYMMHFPSTKLFNVNLSRYYNYDVRNTISLRHDLSYNRDH